MGRKPNRNAGVYYRRDRNKWCARYYYKGFQHYVGSFASEEDASVAVTRYKETLREREEKYRKEIQHRLRDDAKLLRNTSAGDGLLFDL